MLRLLKTSNTYAPSKTTCKTTEINKSSVKIKLAEESQSL